MRNKSYLDAMLARLLAANLRAHACVPLVGRAVPTPQTFDLCGRNSCLSCRGGCTNAKAMGIECERLITCCCEDATHVFQTAVPSEWLAILEREKGGMFERFVKSMGTEVPAHCHKRTDFPT